MLDKTKIYETEIIDITEDGDGVAKIDSIAIFVPTALPGSVCKVRITSLKKNYGFGEVVEVTKASPYEVEPLCEHYYECGGCNMQNIMYSKQLDIKTDIVKNAIKRIGGLNEECVKPCIGMENPWKYRNKVVYHVQDGKIGLYGSKTKDIVEINHCHIAPDSFQKAIEIIRGIIPNMGKKISIVESIMIRSAIDDKLNIDNGDSLMLELRVKSLPGKSFTEEFKDLALSKLLETGVKSISANYKGKTIQIYGSEKMKTSICDKYFVFSTSSFLQVNHSQGEALYRIAQEYTGLDNDGILLDIYSGVGTISLIAGDKAKKIYGIEIWKNAVADAKENAAINNMSHKAEFFDGAAEKIMKSLMEKGRIKAPDVITIDPPRAGCDNDVIGMIGELNPRRIVYISCKPSTLARDLKKICEKGFVVEEIQPVDMFSHSTHVECAVSIKGRVR